MVRKKPVGFGIFYQL